MGKWYNPKFVLFGDGRQAGKHIKSIEHIGGEVILIHDPIKYPHQQKDSEITLRAALDRADYAVICTPNYLHYRQTLFALSFPAVKVIVEKPLSLPWEPIIDDDRVNIVLQFRYFEGLPKEADLVKIVSVRGPDYFKTWKGDARLTGGIFYHLFVHYIDLAIELGAKFEGHLISEGTQGRIIQGREWTGGTSKHFLLDLVKVDMQELYNEMYNGIVNENKGVKPKDIFYLNWIMNKYSMRDSISAPYKVTMNEWRMNGEEDGDIVYNE